MNPTLLQQEFGVKTKKKKIVAVSPIHKVLYHTVPGYESMDLF